MEEPLPAATFRFTMNRAAQEGASEMEGRPEIIRRQSGGRPSPRTEDQEAAMCRTALRFAFRLGLTAILLANSSFAATPSSGTVSQTNLTLHSTGQTPIPPAAGSSSCGGPNNSGCDNFKLTIVPPDATFGPFVVVIQTVSAPGA